MKKSILYLSIFTMFVSCSAPIDEVKISKTAQFVGIIDDNQTKVTVSEGVLSWENGDAIGIFAADGENNVPYDGTLTAGVMNFTVSAGATAVSNGVGAYYAYYPYTSTFPYNLNTYSNLGLDINGDQSNVAQGQTVDNKCYVPVTVEQNQIVYTNAGGTALTGEYAQKQLLAGYGATDVLTFQPVLGVLELGLKGDINLKEIAVSFADQTAATGKLSGKGVLDLTTKEILLSNFITPSYVRAQFYESGTTTPSSLQLTNTEQRVQLIVTDFCAKGGLYVTFRDVDDNSYVKHIWALKSEAECSSYTDAAGVRTRKHIYQPLSVVTTDAMSAKTYYALDMSGIDFADSYIYDVTANGKKVAMVTKEFLGKTVNQQAVVVYPYAYTYKPYPLVAPNVNNGYVQCVTKVATTAGQYADYSDASGDIHGGVYSTKTNAYTTEGISAVVSTLYIAVVAADGSSEILAALPDGKSSAGAATIAPQTLTLSDRGDTYAYKLVKIGTQYWMAENLHTTKLADGTPITEATTRTEWLAYGTPATAAAAYMASADNVFYNAYAAASFPTSGSVTAGTNYSSPIAPDGWKIPSANATGSDFVLLKNFVSTSAMVSSAHNNITLFSSSFYGRVNASTGEIAATVGTLYWSTTIKTLTSLYFCKVDETGVAGIGATSGTNPKTGMSLRLVKE